ncbi:hypothetical protein EJ04DRAFT_577761 [Polyplosphaeria fusca]|uniref:Zn(2)-C6 fungal-type domain-containing protein n=1 Tax=Polyplosphaeria fusca TaxID=682080 RepID=A0A9P4QXT9_9PLEO|nr:hypothetical protein EJ04DRAFT_577761 [Polyplosphaeria fusca]
MSCPKQQNAEFQVLSFKSEPKAREYRKRAFHRKTNLGCVTCKSKKVKCDEVKPTCLRCQRNGRQCLYERVAGQQSRAAESAGTLSSLSSTTILPYSTSDTRNGTPSMHLMRHFEQFWPEIVHIPRSHDMISFFKTDQLVRHTILALAASHLRHMSPDSIQHRVAEHYQQSLALEHYSTALATPHNTMGQDRLCAVIISATFLNMLAFTLPSCQTDAGMFSSWVFNPDANLLGWLALQAGLRPLLHSMANSLGDLQNFLAQVFLGSGYEQSAISRLDECLKSAPMLWLEVFELVDTDPCNSNCELSVNSSTADIIKLPVAMLAFLRVQEPVQANITKSCLFLSKVHPEFRNLLLERNEKALWIFGYWLGLMCRYGSAWWCAKRVRRDYEAIGMWLGSLHLDQCPGIEGLRWKEMMQQYELADRGEPAKSIAVETVPIDNRAADQHTYPLVIHTRA